MRCTYGMRSWLRMRIQLPRLPCTPSTESCRWCRQLGRQRTILYSKNITSVTQLVSTAHICRHRSLRALSSKVASERLRMGRAGREAGVAGRGARRAAWAPRFSRQPKGSIPSLLRTMARRGRSAVGLQAPTQRDEAVKVSKFAGRTCTAPYC